MEDEELNSYLNTPAETKLKDIVWTAMNQDYIEKQALKAALQPKVAVSLVKLWHKCKPSSAPGRGNLKHGALMKQTTGFFTGSRLLQNEIHGDIAIMLYQFQIAIL